MPERRRRGGEKEVDREKERDRDNVYDAVWNVLAYLVAVTISQPGVETASVAILSGR